MDIIPLNIDQYVETRICKLLNVQYTNSEGVEQRIQEYFCSIERDLGIKEKEEK